VITHILFNSVSRDSDTMVSFLLVESMMNGSTKLSREDVQKAYRTVHASIKQNHKGKKEKKLLYSQEMVLYHQEEDTQR
jgi:phosphomannomutase